MRHDWNRNELILALELYFRLDYGQMDGRNIEVVRLSEVLRLMNRKQSIDPSFRSVNSVALKLANLKRIDPNFTGKGMKAGSVIEKEIWNEYANDKVKLRKVASALIKEIVGNELKRRRAEFKKWLKEDGQPNGKAYQPKTIGMYANWIGSGITKEFEIQNKSPLGLYGITSAEELDDIEEKYLNGDTKRRKDFVSGFHAYKRFIHDLELEYSDSDENSEVIIRTEGGQKVLISLRAERDPMLRRKAIQIHGTRCMVCSFNFEEKFGDWGKGFIEVHHLVPLAKKRKRETNPISDLVVICSNCHRMMHRKKNIVLTIEELKNKMVK